ncbi:MAG: carbohydrate kinase family protein [Anaerolineae bacterium]|nr:carbohydrate kinase family protein [Anaerolineae bacterium]
MVNPILRNIIIGKLQREFVIPLSGKPVVDGPGGNLLYAASGLAIWDNQGGGLVSKVGEEYPRDWIELARKTGFDTRGIKILPESIDLRFFCAFQEDDNPSLDSPISHFARLDIPFPHALLGYTPPVAKLDSRTTPDVLTIRPQDIPDDYFDASAVHLCPIDYLTHALLPGALRQGNITTITIDPSENYMSPSFWDDVPSVVKGITAFLTSETKLRSLFKGRSADPWEMAEAIAGYGCEIVVIKRRSKGQWVYEHASRKRWTIPAYIARVVNPLGAGDAFCGGFLYGYTNTYDAVEATLHGNISASLSIEGTGPFYALDSLPGLAQARLDSLRDLVAKAP